MQRPSSVLLSSFPLVSSLAGGVAVLRAGAALRSAAVAPMLRRRRTEEFRREHKISNMEQLFCLTFFSFS